MRSVRGTGLCPGVGSPDASEILQLPSVLSRAYSVLYSRVTFNTGKRHHSGVGGPVSGRRDWGGGTRQWPRMPGSVCTRKEGWAENAAS